MCIMYEKYNLWFQMWAVEVLGMRIQTSKYTKNVLQNKDFSIKFNVQYTFFSFLLMQLIIWSTPKTSHDKITNNIYVT